MFSKFNFILFISTLFVWSCYIPTYGFASTTKQCRWDSAPPYFKFNTNVVFSPRNLPKGSLVGYNPLSTTELETPTVAQYFTEVIGPGSRFETLIRETQRQGFRTHVYLGGPHGNTGDFMAHEERKRRDRIITDYQLTLAKYKNFGWFLHTKRELLRMNELGIDTYEIDNLNEDASVSESEDPKAIVNLFVRIFAELKSAEPNFRMKLVMKNLTGEQMDEVRKAIQSGRLKRDQFADYAIVEKLFSNLHRSAPVNIAHRNKQYLAANQLGIQLIPSDNTYCYQAEGAYRCSEREPEVLADNDLPLDNTEKRGRICPRPRFPL